MKEFFRRRKHTDFRKIVALFPDLEDILPMMKLKHLEQLMPDVVDEYGLDKFFNLYINPLASEDE